MGNTSALNDRRPKSMIFLLFHTGPRSGNSLSEQHYLNVRLGLSLTELRLPKRLFGTCFEKMLTNLVSSFGVWSNSADAIASINSRCALNSARKSPTEPLRRSAKSLSAVMLIWHCTICCPFLIVNLNAIKSASYPTAFPRVSGINQLAFQLPVEMNREVGPPAPVLLPNVTDPAILVPSNEAGKRW